MILPYLEILIWPVTVLIVVLILRPVLQRLLQSSKVKIQLFGVTIETDLFTLESVIAGGSLSERHEHYLRTLLENGEEKYSDGVTGEERKLLRPLRNSGLIMTILRGAFLGQAEAVRLIPLGRLLIRAKNRGKANGI